MIGMTNSSPVSRLASEFDDFLFAPVGEERNGMSLSVLSTLARLDLDPWQEAAKLAGAPGQIATERLASLITSLPGRPSTLLDSRTTAATLIALLPRRAVTNAALGKTLPGGGAINNPWAIAFMIVMALTMGIQWAITSHQPSTKTDSSVAAASGTVSPHIPPPSAGR